ncbi:MAG: hypothetical protein H0U76_21875 [Ktedonobacteraceae bacterium]|nr:hypothetical protein [Ktedonobacteraceae bacterium]
MRKRIILFIIPVVAFLIMAGALVLTTVTQTHAAGASHHQSKPSHTISTPVTPSKGGGMQPNWSFHA